MKSIGNVGVDDIKSDAVYVKEKEKQAQIVGPLARRTCDDIILNFENEIKVITGNPSNKLTGCSILYNGEILFSEHNLYHNTDRVTLNDSYGNFIRTVWAISCNSGLVYDVTSIDTNTIAVSCDNVIVIVNIDSQNMYIVHTIQNDFTCYGISHCDGKLYYCHEYEGIRRFDLKTKTNELLVPAYIGPISYISCDGNKLFYTSSTETVNCCDMNGKSIWRFEDTAVLRSPRGVVVDNQGFVFVAGEKSGSIVVISPDGNSSKEVYQISSPRAMCYDKNNNKILVCNTGKKVFWFGQE
jgi:DNA-binding beta-propeller fold protein YncE